MKHAALLLTMLTLPLGACAMAPADSEGGEEQTSSTSNELLWYVANPAPTLIDFDTDPKGAAIADGATVNTTYTSWGVTFSCIVCSTGNAFARKPGRWGNGVSMVASPVFPGFDSHLGAVKAEFTTPRSWVSIDVISSMAPEWLGKPTARPWFEAFDAAGQMIGSTVYYPAYGTTGFGQWQTLRIDDPKASIKFVRFSSQHGSPQVYGLFDNLTFNTDPYWVEVTPVERPPVLRPVFIGQSTIARPAP
jgi:hypothetical protein